MTERMPYNNGPAGNNTPAGVTHHFEGMNVLLIEDQADYAAKTKAWIEESFGCTVTIATSPDDALKKIRWINAARDPFAVVISDLTFDINAADRQQGIKDPRQKSRDFLGSLKEYFPANDPPYLIVQSGYELDEQGKFILHKRHGAPNLTLEIPGADYTHHKDRRDNSLLGPQILKGLEIAKARRASPPPMEDARDPFAHFMKMPTRSRYGDTYKGMKVLLVDDKPSFVLVDELSRIIGCEVEVAYTPAAAIDEIRKANAAGNPFGVIISDLAMPGHCERFATDAGVKFLGDIRQEFTNDTQPSVIVLSSVRDDPNRDDPREVANIAAALKKYSVRQFVERHLMDEVIPAVKKALDEIKGNRSVDQPPNRA